MIWTPELASFLEDAPWPADKEELIDYAERTGAPLQLLDNLGELDDDETVFEGIEDIWPEYINQDDTFFFDEEEDDEYY